MANLTEYLTSLSFFPSKFYQLLDISKIKMTRISYASPTLRNFDDKKTREPFIYKAILFQSNKNLFSTKSFFLNVLTFLYMTPFILSDNLAFVSDFIYYLRRMYLMFKNIRKFPNAFYYS